MKNILFGIIFSAIAVSGFAQQQDTISYNNVFIYCNDTVFGEKRANIGEQHTFTLDCKKLKRSIYYTKNSAISRSIFYSYNADGQMSSYIKYFANKPAVKVKCDLLADGKIESKTYSELASGKKLAVYKEFFKYDKKGNIKQTIFADSLGADLLKLSYKYDKQNNVRRTKHKGDISILDDNIILSAKYAYNSNGKKESETVNYCTPLGVKEFSKKQFVYNNEGKLDSVFVETNKLKYKEAYHYKKDGEFYYFERLLDGKKVYQRTVNWFTNGKKTNSEIISR